MNDHEVSILSRGLKFSPTPRYSCNEYEIKNDINSFKRKLRLAEYFDHSSGNSDKSIVKNASDFMPPKGRNPTLDTFIDNIEFNSNRSDNSASKSFNISQNESKALLNIAKNDDLVIKSADKGNSVVIMNATHYEDMCHNILNDSNYYEKLSCLPKTHITNNKLIKKYKQNLTVNEFNYLSKFEVKISNFYGLPKIHKSEKISNSCNNHDNAYMI